MLAAKPTALRMKDAQPGTPASLDMEKTFKWLNAIRPVGFGWMTQDLHASGAVGDPTAASAEKGRAALEHGARAFIELLHDVDRFDLARLKPGPLDR
jgi:creatinine amidohydrolase